MTTEPVYQGGCLCGDVRYTASGSPQATAICHCRSCQRAFGAASVGWACFGTDQIKWRGDSIRIFKSSKGVERSFCAHCGTSLSYHAPNHTTDLAIASLDDPEQLEPQREVYLSHRISWNARNPTLPGHQKFRSDEEI